MNNSKRAFLIAKRAASVATRATVYLAGIAASFVFELCMTPISVSTNFIHFIKFNLIDRNLFSPLKGTIEHYSAPKTLEIVKSPFKNLYNNCMLLGNDLYNHFTAPLQTELERVTEIEDGAHAEQSPSYFSMLKSAPAFVYSKMPAMPVFRIYRSNNSSSAKPKLA